MNQAVLDLVTKNPQRYQRTDYAVWDYDTRRWHCLADGCGRTTPSTGALDSQDCECGATLCP